MNNKYPPEHADLALDVTPLSRGALGDQVVIEPVTHADNAASHVLDFTLPLPVESLLVKDGGGDARAMDGRIGIHWSDNDLQLAVNTSLLLRIGGDKGECTDTLAIQTHVLGE